MPQPPSKPNELVVMTWDLSTLWGQGLKEAVSDPFSRIHDIPVRHVVNFGMDYPDALLDALREGKRPPVDVIYGNTIPAMQAARQGWCDPLNEEDHPVLKDLHPRAKPEAPGIEDWPLLIAYDVRYVLLYREAAFPEGPPDSWNVLLDDKHKGRVSLYPGGKGFFPIGQVMGGGRIEDMSKDMTPCWSFLKKVKPNLGPMDFNVGIRDRIQSGSIDLFFTVITNVLQYHHAGWGVSWACPKEGIGVGDDSLHVPAGLPENAAFWAKEYVAFAMGRDVQQTWGHKLGLCPMRTDVEPLAELEGDAAYPAAPDDYDGALFVPNSVLVDYETGSWKNEFNRILNMTG